MAMSGVELDAECKVVYDEVQSKKKHRYVTFMIADGKIKVDKVCYLFFIKMTSFIMSEFYFKIGDRDATYDQFLVDLCVKDGEADDCRYAIYDYEYVVKTQGTEASNR